MTRLGRRGAVGVLAAALASGCLGGQTGQPEALETPCASTDVGPTDLWSNTTVQAAAAAFVGTYRAELKWQVESRYATSPTPVDFQDNAELTLTYANDTASRDCRGQLTVPVWLTFTTGKSGVSVSGPAALSLEDSAQGLVGWLVYTSPLIKLGATLDEVALAHAPRGSFDALGPDLPGQSATFTEVP